MCVCVHHHFVDSVAFNQTIFSPHDFGHPMSLNFNTPDNQTKLNMFISMTENLMNASHIVLNCNFVSNTPVSCTFNNVTATMTPIQMNYTLHVIASSGDMNTTSLISIVPNTYYGMIVTLIFHLTQQHTTTQRISHYCQKCHSLLILNHTQSHYSQSMWKPTNCWTITIHLFVNFTVLQETSQPMQWLETVHQLNSIALHNHFNLKKHWLFKHK